MGEEAIEEKSVHGDDHQGRQAGETDGQCNGDALMLGVGILEGDVS